MNFLDRFNKITRNSALSEDESLLLDRPHCAGSTDSFAAAEIVATDATARSLAANDFVILEQAQPFSLLKNPQNGLFSIWVKGIQASLFRSTNWATAYRAWLDLLQVQRLARSHQAPAIQSANALHAWVYHHQNDPWFGQLIYRRDLSLGGVLQYSVQISESIAVRWSAGETLEGILVLDKVGRRQYRLAKWIESQPQAAIAAALHCAIDVFHQRWSYSFAQFNSEHWAKLVVTGHCCCDQADEILAHWRQVAIAEDPHGIVPEVLTLNLDAQETLKAALANAESDHFMP
jgi:hypothetical protein